jgi:membrane protein YqaA with SNARE-associated domain
MKLNFSNFDLVPLIYAVIITIICAFLFSSFPFLKDFGYIGAFLISLISSASLFFPVPGFVIVFSMGAFLDPILLGIAAGIGSGLGELTGYMAGLSGKKIVAKNSLYKRHKKEIEKYGEFAIFVLAFLPNPVFDLAGIASGALKIPVEKFLLATILGKILRFILIAYFGSFFVLKF